jgi:hypothetical protein
MAGYLLNDKMKNAEATFAYWNYYDSIFMNGLRKITKKSGHQVCLPVFEPRTSHTPAQSVIPTPAYSVI